MKLLWFQNAETMSRAETLCVISEFPLRDYSAGGPLAPGPLAESRAGAALPWEALRRGGRESKKKC